MSEQKNPYDHAELRWNSERILLTAEPFIMSDVACLLERLNVIKQAPNFKLEPHGRVRVCSTWSMKVNEDGD